MDIQRGEERSRKSLSTLDGSHEQRIEAHTNRAGSRLQHEAARMGSMSRREERKRKTRERVALQPALDCEACGALMAASRFRYYGDRIICEACEHQNRKPVCDQSRGSC